MMFPSRGERRTTILAVFVAVTVTGCSSWRPVSLEHRGAIPTRTQWRISTEDRSEIWHSIRLTADSISGVPLRYDPRCGSCRRAIARDEVQTIVVADQNGMAARALGLMFGVLAASALLLAAALSGT